MTGPVEPAEPVEPAADQRDHQSTAPLRVSIPSAFCRSPHYALLTPSLHSSSCRPVCVCTKILLKCTLQPNTNTKVKPTGVRVPPLPPVPDPHPFNGYDDDDVDGDDTGRSAHGKVQRHRSSHFRQHTHTHTHMHHRCHAQRLADPLCTHCAAPVQPCRGRTHVLANQRRLGERGVCVWVGVFGGG